MSAAVRQAPGWWPALVQIVCGECGYHSSVIDMNKEFSGVRVRLLARDHVCGRDEDES